MNREDPQAPLEEDALALASGALFPRHFVGTMNFGGAVDAAAADAIVARAFALGFSAFDTANAYGDGLAETRLGAALAREDREEHAFLVTKCGRGLRDGRPEGLGTDAVLAAARASRDRLGRPIDLLLWHAKDPVTPIAATLDAMAALLEAGVIRGYGLSNHAAWECLTVAHEASARGLPRPVHAQVLYNVLVRDAEREIFPFSRAVAAPFSLSAYNPLAGGLLAREPGVIPKKARISRVPLYRHRYGSPVLAGRAAELAELAATYTLSLSALAYGFLASAPVTVVLGPKAPEHLDQARATGPLPAEALAAIDLLARTWRGTEATATG